MVGGEPVSTCQMKRIVTPFCVFQPDIWIALYMIVLPLELFPDLSTPLPVFRLMMLRVVPKGPTDRVVGTAED